MDDGLTGGAGKLDAPASPVVAPLDDLLGLLNGHLRWHQGHPWGTGAKPEPFPGACGDCGEPLSDHPIPRLYIGVLSIEQAAGRLLHAVNIGDAGAHDVPGTDQAEVSPLRAEVESLRAQLAATEANWTAAINNYERLEHDLAAVRTDLSVARAALQEIDKYGCSTYTGTHRCLDANSGRTRGAQFGADAWCDPCIARDALGLTATPPVAPLDQAETTGARRPLPEA